VGYEFQVLALSNTLTSGTNTLIAYTRTGSDEEKADILAAYTESEGSLDALFENVMCSNVLDDEERFISIVEQAIKTKSVPTFTKWKKGVKDTKGRSKRKEAAKNEAKEAEELAKELGVHDKLFGGSTSTGKDATTDSKGGKKGKAANSKGKGKGNVNDEGVDEDALRALIQSRNSKQNSMNSLIEKLEAKYGAADGDPFDQKPSKGSKKRTKKEEPTSNHQEPTEEEFEALQKKLFSKKKESDGDQADEPKAKKAKKSKKA
jgi:DnaJ family protein C protein 9